MVRTTLFVVCAFLLCVIGGIVDRHRYPRAERRKVIVEAIVVKDGLFVIVRLLGKVDELYAINDKIAVIRVSKKETFEPGQKVKVAVSYGILHGKVHRPDDAEVHWPQAFLQPHKHPC